MSRIAQTVVDEANNDPEFVNNPGAVAQQIVAAWKIEWSGRCVDPGCVYREHKFDVAFVISDCLEYPELLALGKMAVAIDGAIGDVPLDKETVVQMIADLQEMLAAMP